MNDMILLTEKVPLFLNVKVKHGSRHFALLILYEMKTRDWFENGSITTFFIYTRPWLYHLLLWVVFCVTVGTRTKKLRRKKFSNSLHGIIISWEWRTLFHYWILLLFPLSPHEWEFMGWIHLLFSVWWRKEKKYLQSIEHYPTIFLFFKLCQVSPLRSELIKSLINIRQGNDWHPCISTQVERISCEKIQIEAYQRSIIIARFNS